MRNRAPIKDYRHVIQDVNPDGALVDPSDLLPADQPLSRGHKTSENVLGVCHSRGEVYGSPKGRFNRKGWVLVVSAQEAGHFEELFPFKCHRPSPFENPSSQ
jgi:hypothetical protein